MRRSVQEYGSHNPIKGKFSRWTISSLTPPPANTIVDYPKSILPVSTVCLTFSEPFRMYVCTYGAIHWACLYTLYDTRSWKWYALTQSLTKFSIPLGLVWFGLIGYMVMILKNDHPEKSWFGVITSFRCYAQFSKSVPASKSQIRPDQTKPN